MATIVKSFATSGVDGYVVDVEVKTMYGQPQMTVVGLGDTAVKEARERVEAAVNDSGYSFPVKKIVINLAPSDLKKSGSHFDLAIAMGLLIEDGQVKGKREGPYAFIGELSLNARLRAVTGVLPMIMAAKEAGIEEVILPLENLEEASLVRGSRIRGFHRLSEVVEYLEGLRDYEEVALAFDHEDGDWQYDFCDVQGQDALIEYCVVAAAGGHNLLMVGQPGCGKSMIAKRLPSILPPMNEAEALEVTKIYSVAGLLKGSGGLIRHRPFRAPHHNASTNALIGGGMRASPGEVSLAHNGVLFLDEITEFEKRTLEALRQPLEDREVTVSRVKYTNRYPCAFILVAAMNPCACGYFGSDKCKCTDHEVLKYRQKVSGPLLDRIDIQKQVNPIQIKTLSGGGLGASSDQLQARVNAARKIQEARFAGHDQIHCNAQMTHNLIRQHCRLEQDAQRLMEEAYGFFKYSARSFYKFLKIARTMADLDGAEKIRRRDIGAALMSRDLEKDQALIGMRNWPLPG